MHTDRGDHRSFRPCYSDFKPAPEFSALAFEGIGLYVSASSNYCFQPCFGFSKPMGGEKMILLVARRVLRQLAGISIGRRFPKPQPVECIGEPRDSRERTRAKSGEPVGGLGELALASPPLRRRVFFGTGAGPGERLDGVPEQLPQHPANTRFRLLLAAPYRVADGTGVIGLARAPRRALVAGCARVPVPGAPLPRG